MKVKEKSLKSASVRSTDLVDRYKLLQDLPLSGGEPGIYPPSEVIEDQSMTIREILDRHTRGLRTPDAKIGYYDEGVDPLELDGRDFNSLDLVEKMAIIRENREKTRRMRNDFISQEKRKEEAALRSKIASELSAQQAAASDPPKTAQA